MMLTRGARVGGYEVTDVLGVGGMGEVYRAKDTRLGRDVAIKVLPASLASDAERLARFEREAKTLAALNHPNIAHIHGFEDSTGTPVLVMELVEGPTLADRIAKGPIPLDEALPIAKQIAEALEAAHEQGIIHRDLKPANIKVRDDGTVKVLDFGLAKAMEPAGVTGATASMSPTITTPAMTALGVLLGTAAYMSPEQAKGRPADKRADIWAFGCVLYEMLTGRRAFDGEDVSDTLATLLKNEPDWSAFPSNGPLPILQLLRRCLRKDVSRRLQAIGDARVQIDEVLSGQLDDPVRSQDDHDQAMPLWRRTLPLVATVMLAVGFGMIAGYRIRPVSAPLAVTRFTYRLPDDQQFTNTGRHYLAISPDGTTMVYVANQRLYRKGMRDVAAVAIPGTEAPTAVTSPVFAPDGESIVFYSSNALKKIAITGGVPITLCAADNPYGMSWDDDVILFGQGSKGIMRVSATGGTPELLVRVKDNEVAASPQMISGGRAVLYTLAATADVDRWDTAHVMVQTIGSAAQKTIITSGADARYVPTGHIVYALGGVLFAVSFDPRRLEVIGGPVPVVEGIARSQTIGAAQFAFSQSGSLLHIAGPTTSGNIPLDVGLLDVNGNVERLKLPPRQYYAPRISPNGRELAVEVDDGKEADIWVYDLAGTSAIRRLSNGGRNRFPVWTRDSQRVAFQSDREGDLGIFWQRADGNGPAERLTKAELGQTHVPTGWSLASDTLLFDVRTADTFTMWTISVPEKKAAAFDSVRSTSAQPGGTFSPDGRWVAYDSSVSPGNAIEIYVQPFPPSTTKFLIGEGTNPFWSPDGKTLYYSRGNTFWAVGVRTEPSFSFGNPRAMQRPGVLLTTPGLARNYEMAPDGKRFVVVVSSSEAANGLITGDPNREIQVLLNWFQDLKSRVPTK